MNKLCLVLIFLSWLSSSKAIFAVQYLPADIATNEMKSYAQVYDLLLDLHLQEADLLLQKMPYSAQNPTFFVLKSQVDMLHILLKDDERLYKTYRAHEDVYLQNLEQFSRRDNPFYAQYKWAKAEILLQWAAVKLSFDEKWAAAWAVRDAYKLLLEYEKEFPNSSLHKKTLGLIQIILGSVPEKYRWLLRLIGLDANVQQGLQNLKESTQKAHFFQLEAALWEILIDVYLLEKHTQAKANIHKLCQKYPTKKLLLLVHSLVMMKNEAHQLSLFLIKNYEKQSKRYFGSTYPVCNYVYAELFFYSLDYKKAQDYYLIFLQNSLPNQNFVKDAYYKLFLINWFDNQDTDADSNDYFQKCKVKGVAKTAVDKQAANFVAQTSLPPQKLHYARMLTDGGNYEQAWKALQKLSFSSIVEKKYQLEYHYRKARILDKLGKSDEAIVYYQMVIDKGKNEPYYFAANSALLLGYYFREVNSKKARYYFELAIAMKNHEYEESITQKARLALRQ